MTSLAGDASIQSIDMQWYTLFTQCIYTSGGRVTLPMPSRRVAGLTVNGELFYGIATKECCSLQLFGFLFNFKVQV